MKNDNYAMYARGKTEQRQEPSGFFPPDKDGPKILTIDIETSPMEAWVWGLFDQRIGLNQIKKDWIILGYGAKWDGGEVFYEDVFTNRGWEDEALLRNIWRLMDMADIIVTQNGKRFDVRKINARFLILGMQPPRPFKQVDTKVEAAKLAMNTSNKLEYLAPNIAKSYKEKHEKYPGFALWKECLDGNKDAWEDMRNYCMQDVIATEALYFALRPWIVGHPNVAMYYSDDAMRCPKCGSEALDEVGDVFTQTYRYKHYRCADCGGFARGRKSEKNVAKTNNVLVN